MDSMELLADMLPDDDLWIGLPLDLEDLVALSFPMAICIELTAELRVWRGFGSFSFSSFEFGVSVTASCREFKSTRSGSILSAFRCDIWRCGLSAFPPETVLDLGLEERFVLDTCCCCC